MGTTLATKQDLLQLATREDLLSTKQDLLLLKQEMENRFTLLAHEIASLRSDVGRDLAALGLRMTVRLGSMLFVGFGLTIAAMRLWV